MMTAAGWSIQPTATATERMPTFSARSRATKNEPPRTQQEGRQARPSPHWRRDPADARGSRADTDGGRRVDPCRAPHVAGLRRRAAQDAARTLGILLPAVRVPARDGAAHQALAVGQCVRLSRKTMVMQYRVCIRNTATGEERIESGEWEHEVSTILFHWLENNFSCDCNRHLQFLRAGGPGPENDP